MIDLCFPNYEFRTKNKHNKKYIFDEIRKKFILLTPEEWVRQHCLHYLISEKNYPKSLINVEKELRINGLKKRYDIVIYNSNGDVHLVVECKAPHITINQETFNQVARYNMVLDATYVMVTNGLNHYYCQMDYQEKTYIFLKEIPVYNP